MKKMRAVIAVLAAVAMALLVIAPAGALAGPEADHWLHQNNPGAGYCGYAYASIDASNPSPPGSAKTFAEGVAEVKANNPCAWSYGSGQSLPANYLKVQASLRCRWGGGAETVAWNSATVGNTAGTAFVSVSNGGTSNPCQDPDHLGLEERTVVTTQFYIIPAGYVTYTDTTHWVTP